MELRNKRINFTKNELDELRLMKARYEVENNKLFRGLADFVLEILRNNVK